MSINAIFPAGVTDITVNGLHQWDYGRKLRIEAGDLPAIIEVHFSHPGLPEAIVHTCNSSGGVAEVAIPDICLEQSAPITVWIYDVTGTQGVTVKSITLQVIARTQPPARNLPQEYVDQYIELITAINELISSISSGDLTVNLAAHAEEAERATYAITAGQAENATHATTAGQAEKATCDADGNEIPETYVKKSEGVLTTQNPVTVTQGGTGATDKINACKNLGAAMVGLGERIPAGADLNDYTTPGTFYSVSGENSATLVHTPYTETGFKLEVFNTVSYSHWIQEVKANSGAARTFRRVGSKTDGVVNWLNWYQVLQTIGGVLPVTFGGTGAGTAEEARTNLGITPANIGAAPEKHTHSTNDIATGVLPVYRGGTGADSYEGARNLLGVPSKLELTDGSLDIVGKTINGMNLMKLTTNIIKADGLIIPQKQTIYNKEIGLGSAVDKTYIVPNTDVYASDIFEAYFTSGQVVKFVGGFTLNTSATTASYEGISCAVEKTSDGKKIQFAFWCTGKAVTLKRIDKVFE